MLYQLSYEAKHWERGQFVEFISSQLLKLENSLRGSFFTYELFIYTYIISHISLLTGRYELNKLTSLPMFGFIAQLVEHRTGIVEVTGSNPVEALIFFRLLLSSFLNWKIHCEDHSSLSSMTAVQIYELFIYTYIISLLTGRYELNKLTSLPMFGFIAQLVEHRTGIVEVTGSNPVEALIFSGFFFPVA